MFKQLVENAFHAALSKNTEVLSESVNDHAEHHMKTIDHIGSKHMDSEGYHAIHKSDSELEHLHAAHTALAKLHDAHATIHRANGNHEGAEEHEDCARYQRGHATISTKSYGKRIAYKSLETHDEYEHSARHTNEESREAFKNHPLK